MPPSWRDGLVNAFPVPKDRRKSKKASKKVITTSNPTIAEASEEDILPSGPPFPFLQLPAEIRNQVYKLILSSAGHGDDEDDGEKKYLPSVLFVSKQLHLEASYVLYSTRSFKIFPVQDFSRVPSLQELRPMYRPMVTQLEMVVGPSWTSPPRTWRVSKLLAKRLANMTQVQALKVLVQVDPSIPQFEGYRVSADFYTDFCGDLLRDVLLTMPFVQRIEMDGYPGVDTEGPLVSRLVAEAEGKGKEVSLGKTKMLRTETGVQVVFWQ